jgi:hypothetical protein
MRTPRQAEGTGDVKRECLRHGCSHIGVAKDVAHRNEMWDFQADAPADAHADEQIVHHAVAGARGHDADMLRRGEVFERHGASVDGMTLAPFDRPFPWFAT